MFNNSSTLYMKFEKFRKAGDILNIYTEKGFPRNSIIPKKVPQNHTYFIACNVQVRLQLGRQNNKFIENTK